MAARWEEGDIERVRFLASNGLTGPEIAREMRRSIGSVRGIIERANITMPTPERSSFDPETMDIVEQMTERGFPLPVIAREIARPPTTIANLLKRLGIRAWCGPGHRLRKLTVSLTTETIAALRDYGKRHGMTLARTAAVTLECVAKDNLLPAVLDLHVEVAAPRLGARLAQPELAGVMR